MDREFRRTLVSIMGRETVREWEKKKHSPEQLKHILAMFSKADVKWGQMFQKDWASARKTIRSVTGRRNGIVYDEIFNHLAGAYREVHRQDQELKRQMKELDAIKKSLRQITDRRALVAAGKGPSITLYKSNGKGY